MQSNSYVVDPSSRTSKFVGAASPGAIDQLYKMASPVGGTGGFDSTRTNGGGSTINTTVPAAPVKITTPAQGNTKKAEPKQK